MCNYWISQKGETKMNKKEIEKKAKKYRELFLQTIFQTDKEFVAECERAMLSQLIDELQQIRKYEDFYITKEFNPRKVYTHRIIIDVKGQK